MRKSVIIVAVIMNSILMSCSIEEDINAPEQYKFETINIEYTQLDYEIAELINTYRVSQELSVLNILNEASKEAIIHNIYMISQGTLSHDYFYVRSQNLKDVVNAETVSENVAYGYTNAESLVNAWLNSEGHKQNIENPDFTDFGISTLQNETGEKYFTNIFVKR